MEQQMQLKSTTTQSSLRDGQFSSLPRSAHEVYNVGVSLQYCIRAKYWNRRVAERKTI
jgi:hypothetical protein